MRLAGRSPDKVLRPCAAPSEARIEFFQARRSVGRALGPLALGGEIKEEAAPRPGDIRRKGHGDPAPDPPTTARRAWLRHVPRKPSPVAAVRLLGKIKEEEAAPRPGDTTPGACRSLRGPHARDKPERRQHLIQDGVRTIPATRIAVLICGAPSRRLAQTGRNTLLQAPPRKDPTGGSELPLWSRHSASV